jgi:hypothetical protein
MGKLPSLQFYPGDWLRDSVAGCSLAAQGLWLRMMFAMHDSARYGYLCNSDGSPIPPGSVALRCGCTPEQYETLLHELDGVSVPSRTPNGTIFSRRMVRDAERRAKDADRQAKHRDAGPKTPDAGQNRPDKFTFPQETHRSHASVTPMSHPSSSSSSNLTTKKERTPTKIVGGPSPPDIEARRKTQQRSQRLRQESYVAAEVNVGRAPRAGPLLRELAKERSLPQPMTEAQIEARRAELKRQAQQIMRSA